MEWRESQIVRALGSAAPHPASEAPDPLRCILHSTITTFRVEFLLVGQREKGVLKPHVVFQLILEPYHQNQTAVACRLSMEYTADGSSGNGGTLNIKAVTFLESHIQATGSFGFPVTPMGKLAKFESWIRILLGQYNHQLYPGSIRGDMTQFDFFEVPIPRANSQMDGCRDWIAQAFTRFYLAGFVAPFGQELADTPALFNGAEVTYLNFEEHIKRRPVSVKPAPFWFPDIIDKKFSPTPNANNPHGVTIEVLPMWRGRFYDDDVVRHETLQIYHADGCPHFILPYNYRGQSRPGSAGGGSGGGPPPPGGPGGSGPGSSGPGGSAQCSLHGGDAGRRQPQDGRSGAPTSAQPGTSAGGGNTTNATGRHNTLAGGVNRGGGGGSQTANPSTTSIATHRVAGGGNRGGGGGSQTANPSTASAATSTVAGGGNRGGGGGSQTANPSTASVATSTVVKDGKRKRSP